MSPIATFARDANNKLVRRGYWLDMDDRSLVMVMTQGIGAHLTNDEKRDQNRRGWLCNCHLAYRYPCLTAIDPSEAVLNLPNLPSGLKLIDAI